MRTPLQISHESLDGSLTTHLHFNTVWNLLVEWNHRKKICRASFLTFKNTIFQQIMPPKHHPDVIAAPSGLYTYVSMQRNSSWIHNSNYKTSAAPLIPFENSSAILSQVWFCYLNMIWQNKYNQRSDQHFLLKCTLLVIWRYILLPASLDFISVLATVCGIHLNLVLHILVSIFISPVLDQESQS